jgi:hypothetical protein
VRLALVVVIVSHPHRLICLGVIFLSEWRVYGGSALFDPKLLFYSFSLFLLFLGLRVGHAKNHTSPSIYFFF